MPGARSMREVVVTVSTVDHSYDTPGLNHRVILLTTPSAGFSTSVGSFEVEDDAWQYAGELALLNRWSLRERKAKIQ